MDIYFRNQVDYDPPLRGQASCITLRTWICATAANVTARPSKENARVRLIVFFWSSPCRVSELARQPNVQAPITETQALS